MSSGSLSDLEALLGHSHSEMTRKYANLAPGHLEPKSLPKLHRWRVFKPLIFRSSPVAARLDTIARLFWATDSFGVYTCNEIPEHDETVYEGI
jgi:hypothetical protein